MKKLEKVSVNQLQKIKNIAPNLLDVDILFKEIFTLNDVKEQLDLLKHIMAFANSNGGYIIYGVNSNNEWVGLDERSDEKIINDEFISLFKNYFSEKIEIAFNLIEIEKNFYFIIHIEPKEERIVFFKANGTYKIKNWGNNQEKIITVFKKEDSFYRKNTETVLIDDEFIKAKNGTKLLSLVDQLIEPVAEKLDIEQAQNLNIESDNSSNSNLILPAEINKKIEKIVTLEKLAIEAKEELDVLTIANVNLQENIEIVAEEIEKQKQDLKVKEYAVFKFNEEIAQIEKYSSKNRELEAEFYTLMDVKMKPLYDKDFSVANENLRESNKDAITAIYSNLTYQFQYNWEKQVNEVCNNLVNEINENNRIIADLKEDLKQVDLDVVQELKQRLKIVNKEFDILNNKALKLSMTVEKVANLNNQIEILRNEVDHETKTYVNSLISSQFNFAQANTEDIIPVKQNTEVKPNGNLKFEDINLDICVS